ncbi:hypothetical protein [Aureimonas psammosilenae]|uniref:hypothetical protein n=1 Tax=Aureimonas psammosilenae TaxID=2495496 RepID=UPI001869C193|nr:hypothetical protein [Aureimonas psammosilenae]
MSEYPEYLQLRAAAGTSKLLRETADREGKKLAQVMREALDARLRQSASPDEQQAA